MSATGERLSVAEYLARDDPRHTELIDGTVVVDQPTFLRQQTCLAVATALRAWVTAAPGRGPAALSLDVVLPSGDVLPPDGLSFAEPLPLDAVRAPRVPDSDALTSPLLPGFTAPVAALFA